MLPDFLDDNSYLLRDYSSFVKSNTSKLPNLTSKWTDLTISEPDTIFLSNISYCNDLLSYAIDQRFLQTSLKSTDSMDFVNSLCVLTGSSIPFYQEKYFLEIKSNIDLSNPIFIPKGTVLWDDTQTHKVTTLRDALILVQTNNKVPVIPGWIYTSSLQTRRSSSINPAEAINISSIFDYESSELLYNFQNSSKVIFNFLCGKSSGFWITPGNGLKNLLLSPTLEFEDYRFVGFSLESENSLADSSPIVIENDSVTTKFRRYSNGQENLNNKINSHKEAYLRSLQEIYTDINSSVFDYNLKDSNFEGLSKISLSFENNRNSFISSSYVSYTEGYIDIFCDFFANTRLTVFYDFYKNDKGVSQLYSHDPVFVEIKKAISSISINLELDDNCTVKANSLVIEVKLPGGDFLYLTDYNNKIIVPRGSQCYKKYSYLLDNNEKYDALEFNVGEGRFYREIRVSDLVTISEYHTVKNNDQTIRNVYVRDVFNTSEAVRVTQWNQIIYSRGESYYNPPVITHDVLDLILFSQVEESFNILGSRVDLPAHNKSSIRFYDPDFSKGYIPIRLLNGTTIYKILTDGTVILDDSYDREFHAEYPNLVFHDDEIIYFFVSRRNFGSLQLTITLDGVCTFSAVILERTTFQNVYYLNLYNQDGVNLNWHAYQVKIPTSYTGRFGVPKEIEVVVGESKYVSVSNSNYSSKNYYNAILNTEVVHNTIDLYGLDKVYTSVTKITFPMIQAMVYLKPTDVLNSEIETLIKNEITNFFNGLSIGENVTLSSILSKIIHASDYIAYVELKSPIDDVEVSSSQILVLGGINLGFQNADLIQY